MFRRTKAQVGFTPLSVCFRAAPFALWSRLLAADSFHLRLRSFVLKSIVVAAVLLASVATPSVAQQTAPVVVVVKVFATPGRADELQALYLNRLEYFRKAEPDSTFRLHRSTKDTNVFLWYEVYPSEAAYENHVKVVNENYKKETAPTPADVIARPSESETFRELGR